jgi:ArsR family transcriptional regulator
VIDATVLDTSAVAAAAVASAAALGAIADPVRWTVVRHLAKGKSCVCELQEIVPIAQNLLSYHLRILREAGLIVAAPRGRWVDYELSPDAVAMLHAALPV